MNTYKTDCAGVYARGLLARGYAVKGYSCEFGEVTCTEPAVGKVETDAPQEVFDEMVAAYESRGKG